jgi:hypothetical protein
MESKRQSEDRSADQRPSDLTKLICKLRWMGLEDEASQLQRAARTLTTEERGRVSIGPLNTD